MPTTARKLFKADLQLFNDGATGGAESSAATAENAPKVETKPSGSNRRSKSGEFDNVVFGKQETSSEEATNLAAEGQLTGASKTDVQTTSDTLEARKKAYNDFKTEYKDLYQEDFQQAFNRRFKEVKGIEGELAAQKPIIEMLFARYGVNDVATLEKSLKDDTEYWERIAEEHGTTVEGFFAMEKLKQESAELRAIKERERGQQQAQQQVDEWIKEGEAVKALYPSFDFKTEAQNSEFISLLKHGNTVEHAYKVIHFDELTQNAARVAAQTADAQAQARIKSKASRPSENGTSSKSAVIVKDDISSLTRAERAEIAKRVQRGDTIRF